MSKLESVSFSGLNIDSRALKASFLWVVLTLTIALFGEHVVYSWFGFLFGNTKESVGDGFSASFIFHYNVLLISAALVEFSLFTYFERKNRTPILVVLILVVNLITTFICSHACSLQEERRVLMETSTRQRRVVMDDNAPPFKNMAIGFLIVGSGLSAAVRYSCHRRTPRRKVGRVSRIKRT